MNPIVEETLKITRDVLADKGYGAIKPGKDIGKLYSGAAVILSLPFSSGKFVVVVRGLTKETSVEWLCAEVEDWSDELKKLHMAKEYKKAWSLYFWLLENKAMVDLGDIFNK